MSRTFALCFGLALLVHCWDVHAESDAQSPRRAGSVNLEQNKALVRRWINEGFNKRNVEVVDEVFADDFVVGGQRIGRAGLKQTMTRRLGAFPDLPVTITETLAEGNQVVIWYTARGTHRGEFEGIPPTGKLVNWVGSDLLRIVRGRIVEGRFLDDSLGLRRQLGAPQGF